MARILLIDDDANLREVAGFILNEAGHEVLPAKDGKSGLKKLAEEPDLVLTDIRMPGIDGMEVLEQVRAGDSPPSVIVLTAHGTVEQAVQAMRSGAFTYIMKPFDRQELLLTVEQALNTRRLEQDNRRLRGLLKSRNHDTGLIHTSGTMARFVEDLKRAAPHEATVLITGQSGTGKELAARACHDLSPRWDQPFVAINCGAIPAGLMESELFGHAKGSFTGAGQSAIGKIRSAHGGTLFLDEIAELPLALQPKLLRVLEAKSVDPVGGPGPVEVDFRLVCATNRNLEQEAAAGRFREDLLFRISVLLLHLPSLRERTQDVPLLWDHFTLLHGGPNLKSEPQLLVELQKRPWRGNVRELKNLNQRLVLLRQNDKLSLSDLERLTSPSGDTPPGFQKEDPAETAFSLGPLPPGGLSLIKLEIEIIRRALEMCGGNRSKTAIYLDIPRHVLVYRMDKYKID
ncbi:MAG: sigma-54 dependent transcriptional regulator [Gemmatimonadales bacterium]|nr:sigma-54 dependent transcriptional regulator [Gemmatimonadales bacterium]